VHVYKKLIGAELSLPNRGNLERGVVTKRVKDEDGNLVGISDPNPMKDTALYEVEFNDGTTNEYTANVIAEHIYNQCNEAGSSYSILQGIISIHVRHRAATAPFHV